MNIRKITDNFEDTLITLDKIYKEYQFEPVSSKLNDLRKSIDSKELQDPDLEFISAFENGAEIGVLVTKNKEICALSIKKYAQKRGVGKSLLELYLSELPEDSVVKVEIEPDFIPFYTDLGFEVKNPNDPPKEYSGIEYVTMTLRKEK